MKGAFQYAEYFFTLQPCFSIQRGARVVEGARLESVYTGNGIEGSNPFLSAYFRIKYLIVRCLILFYL